MRSFIDAGVDGLLGVLGEDRGGEGEGGVPSNAAALARRRRCRACWGPRPSTREEKIEEGVSRRMDGRSNSATCPSDKTRTRSASMMVFNLCAIMRRVDVLHSVRRVVCTRASVSTSTDAVASSKTRTLDWRSRARARQSSCLCPTLKFSPPSATVLSSLSGICCTADFRCACSNTCQRSASLYVPKGSKLERMVPLNNTGSCGMILSLDRRSCIPMEQISTPSSDTDPDTIFSIL
mmetsp:Transcript_694/g.1170  ORF Transcript_694/g.1170 Transcript_694/m.1170 type:complete len:236 (-) Transcript_694:952-1659(-)